jgi:hypothetical protein
MNHIVSILALVVWAWLILLEFRIHKINRRLDQMCGIEVDRVKPEPPEIITDKMAAAGADTINKLSGGRSSYASPSTARAAYHAMRKAAGEKS